MKETVTQVNVSRVVPNISSARPEETAEFFVNLLGFDIVMDAHSVITLASPVNQLAQINILRVEGSPAPVSAVEHPALQPPQLSVDVDDVDSVWAMAVERGLDIRYPITDENWGVRRFFVAEPNGLVINILSHN
jgi:catechol 2,3-dioxygenase-like lactoylglutathione lyase family enzyme